jgi:hypothetical protein
MDKENVVYRHSMEYDPAIKKEWHYFICRKCMELEIITLSKISQTQRQMSRVFFPHRFILDLKYWHGCKRRLFQRGGTSERGGVGKQG